MTNQRFSQHRGEWLLFSIGPSQLADIVRTGILWVQTNKSLIVGYSALFVAREPPADGQSRDSVGCGRRSAS